MSHVVIAPLLLPLVAGIVLVLIRASALTAQRAVSMVATLALSGVAMTLLLQVAYGSILVYQLGNWQAPFGIVLVADRLSAAMVAITALLALGVLTYAVRGADRAGRHFHRFFQFQLFGLIGAFLTGDLFNLFVFFEVLLIASYALLLHGGGRARTRAGVHYVVLNLVGSSLFLVAVGTLYGVLGTLNMADLAVKMSALPAEDQGVVRAATLLLFVVFALKAALAPLQLWLPGAYSSASAPVAALFAIMTKVGAYAIIRVYTIVFPPDLAVTADLHSALLLPAALISLAIGMVGVLAAGKLDRLVAFAVIGSMGMVMVAIAMFTPDSIAAALYYIVHSTLAAGALFLIVDLVRTGRANVDLVSAPPVGGAALTAGLFFVAAIAMAGLPPLSGFVGKLMILDAAYSTPAMVWIWAIVLSASLISVVGFARAGSIVFWKAQSIERPEDEPLPPSPAILSYVAVGGLLGLLVAHTVFAGPVQRYMAATSAQLFAPEPYISTVLDTPGKLSTPKEAN